MRRVIEEAGITSVKLARESFEDLEILILMYADDLVAMCDNVADLESFVRAFEKVTQELGLTMNIKKACIVSLKQLKEGDEIINKIVQVKPVHKNIKTLYRNIKNDWTKEERRS
ncbi:unnamed protein product [Didymodactylos carnosus]|uniref:Reverse transcriptase domain-containing protein n=1 Tax=Didymodactylos carnosus TaxID=1234261 RepID=A0A814JQX1_9BILA|nr:unnamed protein product [Didymodactylos carnosus]CAF1042525.1 unnamed protein product [Didymodactylos carnosus]CAF3771684.1 unnamed protein product [Didymodactylos carnosus]CAF3812675.1 unnamed protein product [Didymodactylos carnosus]